MMYESDTEARPASQHIKPDPEGQPAARQHYESSQGAPQQTNSSPVHLGSQQQYDSAYQKPQLDTADDRARPGSASTPPRPPKYPSSGPGESPASNPRKSRPKSTSKARRSVFSKLLVTFVVAQSVLLPAYYLWADNTRAPDFLREYGVVGNITSLLTQQAPTAPLALPLSFALRNTVKLNAPSQSLAASQGALEAADTLVGLHASPFRQQEGLRLLHDLVNDNKDVKDLALKQGIADSLLSALKETDSDKTSSLVAEVVAVFAADKSSSRKKQIVASGLMSELVGFLEGGHNWNSEPAVKSAWAIANLLADTPAAQSLAFQLVLPKTLRNLVNNDLKEKIIQPTIFAIGNLAARHPAGQEALRQAGLMAALTRIIKKEVEGVTVKKHESFHTATLEHISELQRSDPVVRAALSQMGGLEELLGIMESGAKIEASKTSKEKQLVAVQDGKEEVDEMDSIRAVVRDLQDEADTETSLIPDVKMPGLSVLGRSPSGARILQKLKSKKRQQLVGDVAWALSLLVADNPANQNAAREAGALEGLVKLLEIASDGPTAKHALTAIANLIKNNPENKAAVRDANGIQGLVKLLASNPADQGVLQATAEALKFMAQDRPAYEHLARDGLRWIRALSRQFSVALQDSFGINVSPSAASGLILGLFTIFLVSHLALIVRAFKIQDYE